MLILLPPETRGNNNRSHQNSGLEDTLDCTRFILSIEPVYGSDECVCGSPGQPISIIFLITTIFNAMDEIIRARRLTAEILERAASIKVPNIISSTSSAHTLTRVLPTQGTMADVNTRMQRMESFKTAEAEKAPPADPETQLMDLPDDLLGSISKALGSFKDIVTLSRVSLLMICFHFTSDLPFLQCQRCPNGCGPSSMATIIAGR